MAPFRFADILLTLVVLLITFAILYLVDRGRKQARKRKEGVTGQAGTPTEKKHSEH